jgi:hypothetical protein
MRLGDFQLYFQDTYCLFNGVLAYITGTTNEETPTRYNVLFTLFSKPKKNDEIPIKDFLAGYQQFVPEYGWFQNGPIAQYISLHPYRQNRRGFCWERTTVFIPNGVEVRNVHGYNPIPEIDITTLVKFEHLSLVEGYKKLMGGDLLGVALSPTFAIASKFNSEYPVIFYKDKEVGFMPSVDKPIIENRFILSKFKEVA